MPYLSIALIPHLIDNKAGVVDSAECNSRPMQGVGLPPLHVEVQELEEIYLFQDEVESRHGENFPSRLDLLIKKSSSSSLPSPHLSFDKSESSSDLDGTSSSSPLPSK